LEKMKKIISFALWGDDPRYTHGALKNIDLAQEVYPDWTCRFHTGKTTPKDIIDKISSHENCELIIRPESCDWTGMFWRFEDASDPNVDVMICRDVDSRLTRREASAVNQWLDSGKKFHIMRDHPYHLTPILGGMWGVRSGFLSPMKEMIEVYTKGDFWQVDQNFLKEKVYPLVRGNVFVHDEFFGDYFGEPVNAYIHRRDEKHFIGQAYAGDDKILDDDCYFHDYLKNARDFL
jgi:protein O-GlcNAc transferase